MRSSLLLLSFLVAGCLPLASVPFDAEPDRLGVSALGTVRVESPQVDFGDVAVGSRGLRTLTLTNRSLEPARVRALDLPGAGAFALGPDAGPWWVESGQSLALLLTYTPTQHEEVDAELGLRIEQQTSSDEAVRVTGRGVAGELSLAEADAMPWWVELSCSELNSVWVQNTGNADLQILSIDLASDAVPADLTLASSVPSDLILGPGQEHRIDVLYTPRDLGLDTATLHVASDAPGGPLSVPVEGLGASPYAATESHTYTAAGELDVLVVVGAGTAGSVVRTRLAAEVEGLIDVLTATFLDTRIGVVGAQWPNPGTLHGTPAWVDPWSGSAGPDLAANLSTVPATTDQLFDTALRALDPLGPNPGFLRPDALLHVIFVSDRDDAGSAPASDALLALQGLKLEPDAVVLSTLSGAAAGCTGADVEGAPAPRLEAVATPTGGIQASVCDPSYAAAWEEFGLVGLRAPASFELEDIVVHASLAVRVNGAEASGWVFDSILGRVVFPAGHALELGDLVEIDYESPAECY